MAPNTRVNCVAPGFVPTRFADFITSNESVVSIFETNVFTSFVKSRTFKISGMSCGLSVSSQRKDLEEKAALKRLGTTEDMAAATAFLASDDASYITGETLVVAGGLPSRL